MEIEADRLPVFGDVYITDELDRRPPRPADPAREKMALQALAARMADGADALLPCFVQMAMELTGSSSAGLSLFEPEPAPGVFRWHHLQGILAPYDQATTPREHSPCGVTLDRNTPVLARHPERIYEWIAAENLVIPEVLLVPLYAGSDEPVGTLWVVGDEAGHFRKEDAAVAAELATFVGTALKMGRREEGLRHALDEQEVLAREMSHRLKNLFAMTEGMIRVTARHADTPQAMAEALSGRLRALSDAHALVRRKVVDIGEEEGADLRELILAVVKAHQDPDADAPSRFVVEGPPVECGGHAVNGIALLFHELATNAAKYGALSRGSGRVNIAWRRDGERLVVTWQETGGPRVEAPPGRTGFGATLARRTVVGQFAGTFDQDWRPEGLACTLVLDAAKLDA